MGLEIATKWAKRNDVERPLPKIAAYLTDGKQYAVGLNSRKTHPLQLKFNPDRPEAVCLHAEIAAIVQGSRLYEDLSGFSMYVARVLRDGSTACAKPCKGCQRAIVAFNIKNVEWTE